MCTSPFLSSSSGVLGSSLSRGPTPGRVLFFLLRDVRRRRVLLPSAPSPGATAEETLPALLSLVRVSLYRRPCSRPSPAPVLPFGVGLSGGCPSSSSIAASLALPKIASAPELEGFSVGGSTNTLIPLFSLFFHHLRNKPRHAESVLYL